MAAPRSLSARLCVPLCLVIVVGLPAAAHADFPGLKSKLKDTKKLLKDAAEPKADKSAPEDGKKSSKDGEAQAPTGMSVRLLEPDRRGSLGSAPSEVKPRELVFSPDSTRVAYVGRVGSRQAVIMDGSAGPTGDEVSAPKFTADGSRIVYTLRRGDSWHVVIDDEVSTPFERISEGPILSPVGSRIAYVGYNSADDGDRLTDTVVVDGTLSEPMRGVRRCWFTADGERFAYEASIDVAEEGAKEPDFDRFLVVEGERIPWSTAFTGPESSDIVGLARTDDGKVRLYINGMVGESYDKIDSFKRSPHGKSSWCFAANKTGRNSWGDTHLLVNGEQVLSGEWGGGYRALYSVPEVVFSANGEHFVIVEPSGRGARVRRDGQAEAEYDAIEGLFVADSGDVSYFGFKDEYAYRVDNGEEAEGIKVKREGSSESKWATIVEGPSGRPPAVIVTVYRPSKKPSRGGMGVHETPMEQLFWGEYSSGAYDRGIKSVAFSGDGKTIAFLGSELNGDDGIYLESSERAPVKRWESAINGPSETAISLGENGDSIVLYYTAKATPRTLAIEDGGEHPEVQVGRGSGNMRFPFLMVGGEHRDLYAGRPLDVKTKVAQVFPTRDGKHFVEWLSVHKDGQSYLGVEAPDHLLIDGVCVWIGEPLVPAGGAVFQDGPEPTSLMAYSFINDGATFRFLARNGENIEMIEYDLDRVIAALK